MDFRAAVYQVWTIAWHSLVQAMRMKVAVVLIIFTLIMVIALPLLLQQPGETHEDHLRMVITYPVYLITFLLGLLTLFLSTMTLNTEIKNQHIFLLDPKPMARGTLLVGKWCGVMLIDLILLVVMLGATYGFVKFIGRKQVGESQQGYDLVHWEVLSARRVAQPPLPPLDDWVKAEVKDIVTKGEVPEGKTVQWVEQQVRARMSKAAWIVPPGGSMNWTVTGLPKSLTKSKSAVVVRFKHYADAGTSETLLHGKLIVNEHGQPYSMIEDDFAVEKPHSVGVPSEEVQPDGSLQITYQNKYEPADKDAPPVIRAAFPFEDGIQVLYPAATFGENVIRAGTVVFMRLAFIAIVGIWASTFLSFPVAVLLSLVVFLIGYGADFILNDLIGSMYIFGTSMQPPWMAQNVVDTVIRDVFAGVLLLFPNFGKFDVVTDLSEGMIISLRTIFSCFFWLILVRGSVLALTGWIIFKRRELAAATAAT